MRAQQAPATHRLVCRACGRTEPVHCVVGAHPTSPAGFLLEAAEVVFRGYCAPCRSTGG
ncbi:hypothetical protein [Actinophytocola xanthii]|uniref:hypothetical protein n=1 Tax=Actinophytocola xanthii TaxID=1912961 RepID=UPI0013017CA6|nr:hypothetical protein [Actinophytocola xanthii]